MTKETRILVVDDDLRMTKTIVDILDVKGYSATAVHTAPEAVRAIANAMSNGPAPFDCLISDIKMPGMDGVSLLRVVKGMQPGLPVVLMTAYASAAQVKAGMADGALSVLPKPLNLELLLSFLDALRTERSVVVVDDDLGFCQTVGDILRTRGFEVAQVVDPYDWERHIGDHVRVVLLDLKLNGVNGVDILRKIRAERPGMPVILMTGHREEMAAVIQMGLKLKAHSCLYKPLDVERLVNLVSALHSQSLARELGLPA